MYISLWGYIGNVIQSTWRTTQYVTKQHLHLFYFPIFITYNEDIYNMRRFYLLFLLLLTCSWVLRAQSGDATLGVKGGNSAIFGSYAALYIDANYEISDCFAMRGGAQYSTIGRTSAAIAPQYFHDFKFGRLSGGLIFNYTNQNRMHNYVIGGGISVDISSLWATIGYYHRTISLGGSNIYEPFNFYYELGVRCLPKLEQWDLNVVLSNCRMLEVERHYQPSFAIEGWWYPLEQLGIQMGVNYKPAGMFHISSDYYQFYANIGACYRW